MIGIVPAAGLGERMQSVTMGGSKEALPLGGKSILDWVLDELIESGATRIIVVSRREKRDIEEIIAKRSENIDLCFQSEPKGLMNAIAIAGILEDSVIALPDTVFSRHRGKEFISECRFKDGAVCVQKINDEAVNQYGIVELEPSSWTARRFLEKPNVDETPSRWAIAARYFLTDRIMRLIREKNRLQTIEEPLIEVFNEALLHGMHFTAHALPAEIIRFDCGSPSGYNHAVQYFGKDEMISK